MKNDFPLVSYTLSTGAGGCLLERKYMPPD